MPDINWSVAAGIRPQTTQDIVSPLTAFANMQLTQARQQELQTQMRLQNAQFESADKYAAARAAGKSHMDALSESGLAAINPSAAQHLTAAELQGNQLGAYNKWAQGGGLNALMSAGPAAVEAATKIPFTQAQTQELTLKNEAARIEQLSQHATGFIQNPTEENRQRIINAAESKGLLPPEIINNLRQMPLGQFSDQAKAFQAQSAEYSKGIAKSLTEITKLPAGEEALKPPGLRAYEGGGQPSPAGGTAAPSGAVARPNAAPPPVYTYGYNANPNGYSSPQAVQAAAKVESGEKADARNGNAAGLMQFMPATGRQYVKGSVFDPYESAAGGQRYAADNRPILEKALGRPPTDGELYLAHQQDGKGAARLLSNPEAKAVDIVGAAAVLGNGGKLTDTARQFADRQINKFNKALGATGSFSVAGPRPGGPLAPMAMTAAMNPPMNVPGPETAPIPPGVAPPFTPQEVAPQTIAANAAAQQESARQQAIHTAGGVPWQPPPEIAPRPPATAFAPPVGLAAAAPGATPTGLPADQAARPLVTAQPAPAAPSAPATPIAAPAPLPGPAENQGFFTPYRGMTIEQKAQAEAMGALNVKQISEAREAFQGAQSVQQNLQQLHKELAALPEKSGGILQPGSGATWRLGLAKAINTQTQALGLGSLFDPDKISASESAQKISGRLGFDLSRTLGSREAAQIVQQAITLNPTVENSPEGARIILASLNAAAQRQKDFYVFQQRYMGENGGSPQNAEIAFDRAHPVGQYVADVQNLVRVKQQAIELLQKHADDPRAAAAFDQTYGLGTSRYFLGAM